MNQNLMQAFNAFMQNPAQTLSRAGIPADMMRNPETAMQFLLDSGRISQSQYNQARNMAQGLLSKQGTPSNRA